MKSLASLLGATGNKQKAFFKWALAGLALVVVYIIYRKFKGKSLGNLIAGDLANSAQASGVPGALSGSGIEGVRANQVVDICEAIYKALHKNDWFGFSEDEEAAAMAFNQLINIAEAKAAARIYQANYNKSLYDDLKSYIHGSTWDSLKSYLLNAIKP